MNEYDVYNNEQLIEEALTERYHLPLDWNKEYSLEKWLERISTK